MSDTMWFSKTPGQPPVSGEPDGSVAMLLGDDTPDWVRLPPELGGGQVRVEGSFIGPCPVCESGHSVRHLVLPDRIGVAECVSRGFLWYRRRPE